MYTVDVLLTMAAEADALFNDRRVAAKNYSELHNIRELAMACAEWMDTNGFSELPWVGPFGKPPFKKGDVVRVKKGARIYSTKKSNSKNAGRNYPVTLAYVHPGYVSHWRDVSVEQPKVEWAGAGGYWCWTDPSNVQLVTAA